jgi:signal peptidase II
VFAWLAGVASAILLLDLVTKVAVVSGLEGRPPVRLVDGVLYLVVTRNTGAAFSLGQGYTIALTLIALLVVGVIVRFARFSAGPAATWLTGCFGHPDRSAAP